MAYWVQNQGRLWDPFREMREEMRRVFGEAEKPRSFCPRINVWANEQEVLLDVQAPGLNPETIDLHVRADVVLVSVERPEDEPVEGAAAHRVERGSGPFSRQIRLPYEVDSDRVKAEYINGVLRVRLPRHEESRPRKVQVKIEE